MALVDGKEARLDSLIAFLSHKIIYALNDVTISLLKLFQKYANELFISVKACKPAADMALADVNKRRDLLPGYKLHLHWNDSEVINLVLST